MFSILFSGFTRFSYLKNQIQKLKIKKSKLLPIVFFIFSLTLNAQDVNPHSPETRQADVEKIDSILYANQVPVIEAEKFGKIVIQDLGGRMMPVNTYASELLRKLCYHLWRNFK